MKNISETFVAVSIITLSSIGIGICCRQSRKVTEEKNADTARKKAYNIIINSIVEYKKHTEIQSFEDFLKLEWPQDYKHFKSGMRTYEEWKVLYNSN